MQVFSAVAGGVHLGRFWQRWQQNDMQNLLSFHTWQAKRNLYQVAARSRRPCRSAILVTFASVMRVSQNKSWWKIRPLHKAWEEGKVLEEQNRKELEIKENTTYLIAKEELPFTKFHPILLLQKKNGLDLNMMYANDKGCNNFVSQISAVMMPLRQRWSGIKSIGGAQRRGPWPHTS